MPVSEDVKTYSDDLMTHLRNLSLAVVTVCVALNAFLVQGDPYRLGQATLMLDEIRQLKDSWSLSEAARLGETHEECGVEEFASTQNAIVIGNRRDFLLSLQRSNGRIEYYPFRLPKDVAVTLDKSGFDALSSFPSTVHDFQGWWAQLKDDRYLMVPFAFVEHKNPEDKDFVLPSVYTAGETKLGSYKADATIARISLFPQKGVGCGSLYLQAGRNRLRPLIEVRAGKSSDDVWIPIMTSSIVRLNRAMFAKRFSDWMGSDYEVAFAALKAETTGIENLTLDQVAERLRARLERLQREVEIGGLKFQMADLAFWGMLIVVSLQLYLLLQIKELFAVLQEGAPIRVSWFGVSSSWLSLCFSLGALCVMPCATLVRTATTSHASSGFSWPALGVSLVIGSWSSLLIVSLRRFHSHFSE